jgi:citrate synthase
MDEKRYLSAKEAAGELGISVATLYAYVSRGMVRAESDGKLSRYLRTDIEALKSRKEMRTNPAKAAERALHWGAPVLDSEITLILDGRLYYRGHDAAALAESASVEQVAGLIWLGDLAAPFAYDRFVQSAQHWPALRREFARLAAIEAFQIIVPLEAIHDPAAYDLRVATVVNTGARIMGLLAAAAGARAPLREGMAASLQRAWAAKEKRALPLLTAALILSADHELNVSAFSARCVASAGSTPYAVVAAGLSALQGPKHGGHCNRVEALFEEAAQPRRARACLLSRLRRGEEIPGFGHRLYHNGDPRGAALLRLVKRAKANNAAVALADALAGTMQELTGEHPTIDFGLVTLARALDFAPGSALGLFAMGRCIGWLGHAIEQYRADQMIRPRARYTGIEPLR